MTTQVFEYNGHPITFQFGESNMLLNATEMAKNFGKNPKDYLRTKSAKEFIEAISGRTKCLPTDLVVVVNGGINYGTWMHEDVALDFAQWLNVEFKLWCNDRIKEILKYGATAVNPSDLLNPDFIIQLATQLKEERAKSLLLEKVIVKNEIRSKFVDKVIASEDMIDIGQCAKILELNFGRNTLFKNLRENGVFFKNKNEPKQTFIERGYFKLKEHFVETQSHGTKTIIKVLVTQKGLGYISTLFESNTNPKNQMKMS